MKRILLIFTLIIFSNYLSALNFTPGNLEETPDSSGVRVPKTIFVTAVNSQAEINQHILEGFKNISIPDNFPLPDYRLKPLPSPGFNLPNPDNTADANFPRLISWLNANKSGQQILSKWYNRKSDGSFDFSVFRENELLNIQPGQATPDDSIREISSIKNSTRPFVNESYLVVFDFQDIITMEQYYDETNTSEENRILNGYRATVKSMIFKFDFNEPVSTKFFSDYWYSGKTAEKEIREKAFENAELPFFLVSVHQQIISSTQHNPGETLAPNQQASKEELLAKLPQLAVSTISEIINSAPSGLHGQSVVSETNPVKAKISREASLKFDNRFAVYQNQISEAGNVQPRRVAVVRSMSYPKFSEQETDNSERTSFYQIAGKKINANEMYLKKMNDAGINIFAGTTFNGLASPTARVEFYFSKLMGGMVIPGKTAKGLTSIKVYFEGGRQKDTYLLNNTPEKLTFTRGSLGFSKNYYPFRFMHWGPFIGYGLEYTTSANSDNILSTNFAEMGVRTGFNIVHNLQLIGSVNYYLLLNSVLMDGDKNVINQDFNYTEQFPGRSGLGYSLGLRLML
jgi:hypothetical protein